MRKRKKIVWGAMLLLLAVMAGFVAFVEIVSAPVREENRAAVLEAYNSTVLMKAIKAERFVGDQPYTVIWGEDKLGRPLLVWVGEDRIHAEYADHGISRDELKAKVAALYPDITILRMTPGILGEEYIWEVYSKRTGPDGKRHYYYDYFRFSDGEHLETYWLDRFHFNG